MHMPPKKRRKREHPVVEHWQAIASLATNIAKLTQQEHQFSALLKQVAELTEHEAAHPEKRWFHEHFEFDADMFADRLCPNAGQKLRGHDPLLRCEDRFTRVARMLMSPW